MYILWEETSKSTWRLDKLNGNLGEQVIIEGVPVDSTDPSRLYRGYIAVDDIDLQPGTSCVGFCNFAGDFCDWNNDAEDDFDWTIVSALSE